ncbi:hypothetical protein E2C01_046186 [Portunus trituberculatus]|uniref:Uncharacterized protein n=1 Tax=Portunus trituberculatus TaxID=210409 RepID=A0A5B7FXS5_PORTR|nr:hypothetical protein [Portunus trituberculatus]
MKRLAYSQQIFKARSAHTKLSLRWRSSDLQTQNLHKRRDCLLKIT